MPTPPKIPIIGHVYGRLKAIRLHSEKGNIWEFSCSCGNPEPQLFNASRVMRSAIRSCGCLVKEAREAQRKKIKPGEKNNKLTALYPDDERDGNNWYFQCDCGAVPKSLAVCQVKSGAIKSCDSDIDRCTLEVVIGETYQHLRVLRASSCGGNYYLCECQLCDTRIPVSAHNLITKKQLACGCLKGVTHGYSGTPTYNSWYALKHRCKFSPYYELISYCVRWEKFENFLCDMGERPFGMTLDRIDTKGDYEPSNCRWATHRQQMNNTSHNRIITYRDEEYTLADFCRKFQLDSDLVRGRLDAGWSLDDVIEIPVDCSSNHVKMREKMALLRDALDADWLDCDEKGNVYNHVRRCLKGGKTNNGYKRYGTKFKGEVLNFVGHRLIALKYIHNSDPEHQIYVHHKDGNKLNNTVDNLEWVTGSQNMYYYLE